MRRVMIMIVSALIISACSNKTEPENNVSESPITLDQIRNISWSLVDANGKSLAESKASFEINDEGRASGFNGCNNYFGTPKVSKGKLTIAPMGSTRKFCEHSANELEATFNDVLGGPSELSLSDGQLTLKKDQSSLTFRKTATE